MLPKTRASVKSYDGQTKQMYFLTEDDDLLERCNIIWEKFSADIKKEFDSEPVYSKKFLKTKIKPHGNKVKVDYNYICLEVINFNFALKKDENCYPEVFLKNPDILKRSSQTCYDNLSDFCSCDKSDEE